MNEVQARTLSRVVQEAVKPLELSDNEKIAAGLQAIAKSISQLAEAVQHDTWARTYNNR